MYFFWIASAISVCSTVVEILHRNATTFDIISKISARGTVLRILGSPQVHGLRVSTSSPPLASTPAPAAPLLNTIVTAADVSSKRYSSEKSPRESPRQMVHQQKAQALRASVRKTNHQVSKKATNQSFCIFPTKYFTTNDLKALNAGTGLGGSKARGSCT